MPGGEMLNGILTGSATLCLLTLALVLLQFQHVLRGIQSQADQIASDANSVAIFTIQTEGAIRKNLAVNLNAITGETGHLAEFNSAIYQTGYALQSRVGSIERDIAAAVFGAQSMRYGERAGLLDVMTSTQATVDRIGDTALTVGNLSEGIRTGYFECPGLGWSQSRFLAITGEGMRLMEASRRTMETVSREAPEFTRNINGITSDFHALTSNAVKKHWYDRVGTVGAVAKGGFVACKILFGC